MYIYIYVCVCVTVCKMFFVCSSYFRRIVLLSVGDDAFSSKCMVSGCTKDRWKLLTSS